MPTGFTVPVNATHHAQRSLSRCHLTAFFATPRRLLNAEERATLSDAADWAIEGQVTPQIYLATSGRDAYRRHAIYERGPPGTTRRMFSLLFRAYTLSTRHLFGPAMKRKQRCHHQYIGLLQDDALFSALFIRR